VLFFKQNMIAISWDHLYLPYLHRILVALTKKLFIEMRTIFKKHISKNLDKFPDVVEERIARASENYRLRS